MLLVESGRHQAAWDHLEKFESQIVDKVSFLEAKGTVAMSRIFLLLTFTFDVEAWNSS